MKSECLRLAKYDSHSQQIILECPRNTGMPMMTGQDPTGGKPVVQM